MTDLFEIDPASDWCQRWDNRQHSWRHRSEGGFQAEEYSVEPLDENSARNFVVGNHYSGTYPAASQRYALRHNGALEGVAVFGIPTSRAVLANAFPDLEPYTQSLELSRFVLVDEAPGNAETWFLARCFTELRASGVSGIVSFADPVPRKVDGQVIFPGHCGIIYQAMNAVHAGRATPRTILVLRDGSVLNSRSIQKVRSQERGHEHVERKLVALGASPVIGSDPALWLREAIEAVGATRTRHGGCHRYLFPLGANRRQRDRITLGFSADEYPKAVDAA